MTEKDNVASRVRVGCQKSTLQRRVQSLAELNSTTIFDKNGEMDQSNRLVGFELAADNNNDCLIETNELFELPDYVTLLMMTTTCK